MMIFSAIRKIHADGLSLNHDSIIDEIRKEEPGGQFGFACMAFEDLWQKRTELSVGDKELSNAIAVLAEISASRKGDFGGE
ncbi:MAG: hypothetical protein IPK64_18010 [bacterium]|nr:hypothetical protein [bacterium]